MFIGITGHQDRPGISWKWVREAIVEEISKLDQPQGALTSLAAGSDQVFADVALALNISLIAIIPKPNYARLFEGDALKHYQRLLGHAQVVELPDAGDDQQSFFNAGCYIADRTDVLFGVWDGEPSKGFGGTADIVQYARSKSRTIIHINPITRKIT